MRSLLVACLLLLGPLPVLAQAVGPPGLQGFNQASAPNQAWTQCRSAIRSAERGGAIPEHLLAAIGRIESGRRDPQTGQYNPWPWTINAEGEGFFYEAKAAAVAAVRSLQARGVRSIDIGCMQVNLMHHPDAFASLEQAFDPRTNTSYAARFLNQLHSQVNDWARAAALYHSATPELGAEYQRKVLAAWPEEKRRQLGFGIGGSEALANAWATTIDGGSTVSSNPSFGRFAVALPPARSDLGGSNIRIIPLGAGGSATQGRSLDAYRAAPIRVAQRMWRPSGS